MDDIRVLQHRCLLNLERRIRDFGQGRPAEERCLRLQKEGDTLRSAGFDSLVCTVEARLLCSWRWADVFRCGGKPGHRHPPVV